jgi:hypothetical protein
MQRWAMRTAGVHDGGLQARSFPAPGNKLLGYGLACCRGCLAVLLACRVVIRHRLGSRLVLGGAVRLSKLYYAWWMQQPAETLSDARLKHMIHR